MSMSESFSRPTWKKIRSRAFADAEEVRYAANVSVWVRWGTWIAIMIAIIYRPEYAYAAYLPYVPLHAVLVALNGFVHHRLISGRTVTWLAMVTLSIMDISLISATVAVDGGINTLMFLMYYPALALFAVMLPSVPLSLGWTTAAAALYAILCIASGPGIDLDASDEKVLFARLVAMYAVVASVNLAIRFERSRRRILADREQVLLNERVELSQTIHDTAVQSAYMIQIGLDSARLLAGESNERLKATLEATSELSKSVIWELRSSINGTRIIQGTDLGTILRAHAETFKSITSVEATMVQTGIEPHIPNEMRSRLFSVAHNALTNAFRHAQASRVDVQLDFQTDRIRLLVSDNGVGLPGDYAGRGHGLTGMTADADRMGGTLIVNQSGPRGGTTVTCEVPYPTIEKAV